MVDFAPPPPRLNPKGYIFGLVPSYLSATTLSLGIGQCRDGSNAYDMSLAAAVTADITSAAAANGLDRKTIADGSSKHVATNTANSTVTGTSTTFLSDFNARTPTFTSFSTSTVTMTGVGTKFLTEVAIGDLIGNDAKGYSRVTAIASDTVLTLAAALPVSDAGGGSVGLKVMENVTVQVASQTARKVNTITSDTVLNLSANSSATASTQVCYTGVRVASTLYTVWLIAGTSGTASFLSTQRTTLLAAPSGYTTSKRRIATLAIDGSSNFLKFFAQNWGSALFVCYDDMNNQAVLAAGTATTYTAVECGAFVPPTAGEMWVIVVDLAGAGPTIANTLVRARGSSAANGTVLAQIGAANQSTGIEGWVPNVAQAFEYKLSAGSSTSTAYIDVIGFVEDR